MSVYLYTICMKSRDLTKAQLQMLFERLAAGTHYLAKLKGRMFAEGFPPDDELFELVARAHEASHALSIRVHYLACGTGQPSRERPT